MFSHKYCYCFYTMILFNINHSFANSEVVTSIAIQHFSFICTQSYGSKYYYQIPIIQFRHTVKQFQLVLFNSIHHYSSLCTQLYGSKYCNNSIKLHSFVLTQLNNQIVSFLTIQFSTSHLFAYSLNVKQFYLTR